METIYRGRTFQFEFNVNVNGSPVDITPDTVVVQIDKKFNQETPLLEKEADVTGGQNGLAKFELTPEETAELSPGVYLIQIHWIIDAGETERAFTIYDDKVKVRSVIK